MAVASALFSLNYPLVEITVINDITNLLIQGLDALIEASSYNLSMLEGMCLCLRVYVQGVELTTMVGHYAFHDIKHAPRVVLG